MGRKRKTSKETKPQPPTRPATTRTALAVVIVLVGLASVAFVLSNRPLPPVKTASADYVDPAACAACHQDVWQTYQNTGMARSFYRPGTESYGQSSTFYHAASDRHYAMLERDGRYFQRRHQLDSQGRETNIVEREIHYVMGSGNHARSYLHLDDSGKLTQMPLGWYAENGGSWAMSPGYDRHNHDGFQRVISYDCMFCHNGYPEVATGADLPGKRARYPGRIPEGIDCQRCHGPGSEHIANGGAGGIVNPAKLSPERQMEVCLQCHLETTSRPLPNILHRYGRGFFSFRPGEPLSDYALFFDHAAGSAWEEKFEINHSAYRLRQSRCFIESGDRLTCTTCHNPHEPARSESARQRYDAACQSCHQTLIAHEQLDNCASCHMPPRRTDDVVHAVMTDHRIQAKPATDLLTAQNEKSSLAETAYRGEVTPYYPEISSDLYNALAQVAQESNLDEGIRRLTAAIEQHSPPEAGFYFELAAAHEATGEFEQAALWFDRALTQDPTFDLARIRLGSALSMAGEYDRAEAVLLQADQNDARALKERGLNHSRQGTFAEAAALARAAIALEPDLPELHNNLGGALAELGRLEEAEAALAEAIRLQPDLAEACFNLGTLLAARGENSQAAAHFKRAILSKPDYAEARFNYAVVLGRSDNYAEALRQLDAALELDPNFEKARELRASIALLLGAN